MRLSSTNKEFNNNKKLLNLRPTKYLVGLLHLFLEV